MLLHDGQSEVARFFREHVEVLILTVRFSSGRTIVPAVQSRRRKVLCSGILGNEG